MIGPVVRAYDDDLGFDPDAREMPRVSVLLVDDRTENLCALEASLEPLGQRLVHAQSGDAALRAVLDEQFAVILMDIRMPGLDGFETLALLRRRDRTKHIPIIFLTAYPEQQQLARSYESGAVDYISKPFDPETLRSKVSVFVHLRQNELALQAAHAELEQRVLARTAELASANVALEREIAERKAMEHKLIEQAHHDGLTGLANRMLLMRHLDHAVAQSRRRASPSVAVMMIDVDRFKVINDSLGHLAGDELLIGIANRLSHCLREVDTAARLGGDEFCVLLDGITDIRDATRSAERFQRALETPFEIEGREVFATTSIGIAMMGKRYEKGEELLRDADAAMYRAKDAGRARYQVFDLAMHDSATAQVKLEGDLYRAIDRRELALHYQPIVSLHDGKIAAFEALLRWNHPERGLVMPGEFLGFAEETTLIGPLGRWVIEEACRQLAAFQDDSLAMHINLAATQLPDNTLIATLEGAIRNAGIAPSRVTVEITESALMSRVGLADQVSDRLREIRELGIGIALDGFGAGYSRLGQLPELAVSTLKIDRTFVQQPAIERAIVSLAHALGIGVTAVGVETAEQLERLRGLACERAQGYFFARPLDAAAAIALLGKPPRW
jgi:diguanylate cyclase (GGDEF)-like protein